ncbi:hypothetical protein NEIPOLOT_01582 [Neisseria polysaccharea ATCC 43768]|nr:hypothetical protein NEIPOLOT_01582 [Neisseria polysaccharea ATCC 43768]
MLEIQKTLLIAGFFICNRRFPIGNLKITDWAKIKNSTSIDYTDELTARDGCYWRGHRISTL